MHIVQNTFVQINNIKTCILNKTIKLKTHEKE